MPLKINSVGGGSVTIDASNTPLNTTLTLPAASGTFVFTGGNNTIQFAGGFANTPSITRFGDTNTGMFFPAADTIAFAEGGIEAMRLDSSGRMGIGTTSPGKLLSVNGDLGIAYSSSIVFNNAGAGSYTADAAISNFWNGSADQLRLQASGNSPSIITFHTGAAASVRPERMRITNDGAVGIGTTSPAYNLHTVAASEWPVALRTSLNTASNRAHFLAQRSLGTLATPTAVTSGTNLGGLAMGGYDGASWSNAWDGGAEISALATQNWTSSARGTALAFSITPNSTTGITEAMRIDANGFVGIGTNSPGDLLDVNASGTVTSYSDFVQFRQTNGTGTFTRILFGQNSTSNMFIEVANQANTKGNLLLQPFGGNIAVGITTTYYTQANRSTLTVGGTTDAVIAVGGGGVASGYLYGSSTVLNLTADAKPLQLAATGANIISFITNGTERARVASDGHFVPAATNTYDLGTTSLRWRNIFTQDLHLSNGIGDYTVIEGEENLYIVNNKSKKSFKFALIEVDPKEVPPKSGD